LTCEELESRLVPAAFDFVQTVQTTALAHASSSSPVVAPQLTELYGEFLPYQAAGQVASFVPSDDLEALDVANGEVAVNVLALVDTANQVTKLGGQVTDVRYLPVAYGMPGIEAQAMLPIGELLALGALADVASVTPQYRVGPAGSAAPSITTNPTSQTVHVGNRATFTAAASGVTAPTVQWQRSTNGGAIFTNIPGATSRTLTFTAVAGETDDEYRAVFSNELGQVSTTAATLRVSSSASAISGAISGNFFVLPAIPDVGLGYALSGSGTIGDWGLFQASGKLSTPGFIAVSTAGGTLTLSNAGGTLILWLQSKPLTGFSALPQEFDYGVQRATGSYAGLSVEGTITIVLTPTVVSGDASAQNGTFTLTIHPGPATNAGIKGVVLAQSQPQNDVLITAQPFGGTAVLAWAVSNSAGQFQLFLPPGKYLIRTSKFLVGSTSETVIVPKHGFARLVVGSTEGHDALHQAVEA
jgi:hypothetical protein